MEDENNEDEKQEDDEKNTAERQEEVLKNAYLFGLQNICRY